MGSFEIYTFTDQPTTCPKCGCRTNITLDLFDSLEKTQYHRCLSEECSFEFMVEIDEELDSNNERRTETVDKR